MPMLVLSPVFSARVLRVLLSVSALGITGCDHLSIDNDNANTDIAASETSETHDPANVPHPTTAIASSAHSISRHIANTVVSADAVKVVHEIVMPTDIPVMLTDYQQAYLDSMQTARRGRQAARQANDADIIFARSIIAHHLGAIRMADIQLQSGSDPEMRKLAEDIIVTERNEILILQNWIESHNDSPTPHGQNLQHQTDELRQEYADGLDDMTNQMMLGIMSPNPDIAFAQVMLPHHKGALAMAQVELRYGDDDKIRHIADNIIDNQEGEIQFIQQWLRRQSVQP